MDGSGDTDLGPLLRLPRLTCQLAGAIFPKPTPNVSSGSGLRRLKPHQPHMVFCVEEKSVQLHVVEVTLGLQPSQVFLLRTGYSLG